MEPDLFPLVNSVSLASTLKNYYKKRLKMTDIRFIRRLDRHLYNTTTQRYVLCRTRFRDVIASIMCKKFGLGTSKPQYWEWI